MTRHLMETGVTTIYEATFSHDNLFCKADILHHGENGWELYEVKASTGLKDQHLDDIAMQCHVAIGAGVPIVRASLVHIDKRYVRQGKIEVEKLFAIMDVTAIVMGMQQKVPENINAMRDMLRSDMPDTDIGPHCSRPYDCQFYGHCWQHVPADSVFAFRDLGSPDGFELYRQGILKMADVPYDSLGWRQKLQFDGVLQQKNVIDVDAIKEFFDSLWYPLAFMDFETTYLTPVPLFDGTRPYQQVPFQYSLHILAEPGAELQHFEFLAPADENPQLPLLQNLLAALPNDACVLTWNQAFEKGRLEELAAYAPDHRQEVAAVLKNIRDLMAPFRRKDIYHWQFAGSYSIKAVLPALVPELSYKGLAVSNGEIAAKTWLRLQHEGDKGQAAEVRQQLLEYCHLDTLAMVRILEKMREMVSH